MPSWINLAYIFFDQDLSAVPVSRENCSTNTDETAAYSRVVGSFPKPAGVLMMLPVSNSRPDLVLLCPDEEFMDISWRISYSGRSPGMLQFADIFSSSHRVNYDSSPSTKSATQDGAELMSQ